MSQFICGGQKYETGGPQEDVIALPVHPVGLPKTIEVEGFTLFLKDSFHISLVCVGNIAEKNRVSSPDFLANVINDFCKFTQDNRIDFIGYRNEFRFVSENERRAVVVMSDIAKLDQFFDYINAKYAINAEYPPTHATLYTLQPNVGIFLTNASDISTLSKIIPNPTGVIFTV